MLKSFSLYHLALLKYLLGTRLKNSAFDQSVNTFFNHQSFRFPKKATEDYLIVLRIVKWIFFSQFKRERNYRIGINSHNAIFDSNLRTIHLRVPYVERLDNTKITAVFVRDELVNSVNLLLSTFIIFFVFVSFPVLFIFSILAKNKLHAAIWLLSLVEALSLNSLLKKQKINNLYFFNCYENDANLLAYILKKNGIFINKIVSEVPLQFWNKILVADKLCLCFKYQEDEYNLYRDAMFVSQIQHWIPETALILANVYKDKDYKVLKNTIGFYSSGFWLRKEIGNIDLKDNAYQNEANLLIFLIDYVNEFKDNKLIIFLHPIEKNNMEKTKEHYMALNLGIEFADPQIQNDQQFYKVDVAVTIYSTLSYGRIFWGFKTLIFPIGSHNFPIKQSFFNNVCAKNEEDLKAKLTKALLLDTDSFFVQNGIRSYTYDNYLI